MNELTQTRIVITGLMILFLFFLAELASLFGVGFFVNIVTTATTYSSECLNNGVKEACEEAIAYNHKARYIFYMVVNFLLYTSTIIFTAFLSFKKYHFKIVSVFCLLSAILCVPFLSQYMASASTLSALVYHVSTILFGVIVALKFIQHNQSKQAETPQSDAPV
jgi:hypothetical protein